MGIIVENNNGWRFTSGLPCRNLIFSTHLMANLRKALVSGALAFTVKLLKVF